MGCKNCKSKEIQADHTLTTLTNSIKDDCHAVLKQSLLIYSHIINKPISSIIIQRLLQVNSQAFDLLTYSFWHGSFKCYSYLQKHCSASISQTEELLLSHNIIPIYHLCENGYINLLKLYLPHYLQTKKNQKFGVYTPIQIACYKGHISIIKYLSEYFKVALPPVELDIHHIYEVTGENCALVAVRSGDFPMIKMLFEAYRADFHIINKNDYGVFQVFADMSKSNPSLNNLSCIVYIVDIIKADITFRYKETLALIDNSVLSGYFQGKLFEGGIVVSSVETNQMGNHAVSRLSSMLFGGASNITAFSYNSNFKSSGITNS